MLSKKHYGIMMILLENDRYVTAETLGKRLQVSTRTVKRYIEDLESDLTESKIEIKSAKGLGYFVKGSSHGISKWKDLANKNWNQDIEIDSTLGRVNRIIRILIERECVTSIDISEELNLSSSSVNKLMISVKKHLNQYNLKLKSKPHYGTMIIGTELDFRALIYDYGFEKDLNLSQSFICDNILNHEILDIEKEVQNYFKNLNIIISDNDYSQLLKHLIISLSRTRKNKNLQKDLSIESKINQNIHTKSLIKSLMYEVGNICSVKFYELEIEYVLYYSGFTPYNYNTQEISAGNNISSERLQFVFETLQDIQIMSGNDFRDDFQFIQGLSVHLDLLLNRIKLGCSIQNPLLQKIKSKYSVEMNLASFVAKKIDEVYSVKLDENEIGFLAMHFGASRERRKCNHDFKVAILCHYGIGTAQLLAEKIRRYMPRVEVVGVYPIHSINSILKKDISCIISTQVIKGIQTRTPILVIEDILSDSAVKKIDHHIQLETNKQEALIKMLHEDAFFKIKANSKEEIIQVIGSNMKAKGLIDDNVISSVQEREKLASTDIGNLVAIPHTTLNGEHQSVIGVGVLEEPIMWNEHEVQIVLMICFNLSDVENIEIFKYMLDIIDNFELIQKLIKSNNMKEIKHIISEEKWMWIK